MKYLITVSLVIAQLYSCASRADAAMKHKSEVKVLIGTVAVIDIKISAATFEDLEMIRSRIIKVLNGSPRDVASSPQLPVTPDPDASSFQWVSQGFKWNSDN